MNVADCMVFQLPVQPGGGVKLIADAIAGAATDAEAAAIPTTNITLILRVCRSSTS